MNMKQTTLITIIMVALVFTGCKSDSDPKCECPNGTVHLVGETCCNYDDCVCTQYPLQEYGKINGIPVYREGITHAQMNGVFAKLEAAYNNVKDFQEVQAGFTTNKVSAIYMTESTNSCTADTENAGKYIIRLRYSWESDKLETLITAYSSLHLQ